MVIPLSHPTVERLLAIMDQKHHWAWPSFTRPGLSRPQLLVHFRNEYATYVRDFPVLLARALGQVPDLIDVRRSLAENIYEEQTGGLSRSASHPELFLEMMEGCGYKRDAFSAVALAPAAQGYRAFLDEVSWDRPWVRGAAVLTIFVEGSAKERRELADLEARPGAKEDPAVSAAALDAAVLQHPLVRLHGVDPTAMRLARVHKEVEGGHRRDAWEAVLGNVPSTQEDQVAGAMERALELWLAYRDEVAAACGISR